MTSPLPPRAATRRAGLVVARLALLAAAMAVATIAFGWWSVPVVAACWGVLARAHRGAALLAAFAAALAWGALLALDAVRGPVGTLAHALGSLFTIGTMGVYAMTLVLPGLLALTAAVVARSAVTARR